MTTNETNQNASLDTERVGIGRDTGMDLSSLLKEAKDSPEDKPKTPLQEMKESKEKNGLGLVVNTNELTSEGEVLAVAVTYVPCIIATHAPRTLEVRPGLHE